MRKLSLLAGAAIALCGVQPASAAVMSVGNSYARSCYEAARSSSRSPASVATCNAAFKDSVLTPDDRVATFVNRGILHYLRGDVDDAFRDYDAALALDPEEPEAWLNKAFAYLRIGQGAKALPMFDTAVAKSTGEPALAHFGRAMAYEETGNTRAAYADYVRARELAPKWDLPVRELERFKVTRSR